jgi:hypothetical protein
LVILPKEVELCAGRSPLSCISLHSCSRCSWRAYLVMPKGMGVPACQQLCMLMLSWSCPCNVFWFRMSGAVPVTISDGLSDLGTARALTRCLPESTSGLELCPGLFLAPKFPKIGCSTPRVTPHGCVQQQQRMRAQCIGATVCAALVLNMVHAALTLLLLHVCAAWCLL